MDEKASRLGCGVVVAVVVFAVACLITSLLLIIIIIIIIVMNHSCIIMCIMIVVVIVIVCVVGATEAMFMPTMIITFAYYHLVNIRVCTRRRAGLAVEVMFADSYYGDRTGHPHHHFE